MLTHARRATLPRALQVKTELQHRAPPFAPSIEEKFYKQAPAQKFFRISPRLEDVQCQSKEGNPNDGFQSTSAPGSTVPDRDEILE